MVETSQARKRRESLTVVPDRVRPPFRCVLVQSIVGAIGVIIAQVIPCEAHDVAFMDYDHMVEQIVPKTPNPPFGNSVLPRAAVAGRPEIPAESRNIRTSALNVASRSKITYWSSLPSRNAWRSCCTNHSLVGCSVTWKWMISRRLCRIRNKQYRMRRFAVITVKKSIPTSISR